MKLLSSLCCSLVVLAGSSLFAEEAPDFGRDVMPLLRKYCNGCHNAMEAESELILEDFAGVLKGGTNGASLVPGKADSSLLWKVVSGQSEPKMPPDTHVQPTAAELAILKRWIDGGAKPPKDGPLVMSLVTPKIELTAPVRQPITSIAVSPDGKWLAVARPQQVEIRSPDGTRIVQTLDGHTGAISDLSFSADGITLVVAAGETGLFGEATLWKTEDWSRWTVIKGHRDTLYSARLNPAGDLLATASYDRTVRLWDIATGAEKMVLTGHNDAIYGLAFDPAGRILASASGDRTVKLWDVTTGERLETFSQPSKEQYTVVASPDGRLFAGGGADNRIRVWEVSPTAKEGTNPIRYARFAHEGPILKLAFSPDGRLLASSSEDRLIKIWETQSYTQVAVLPRLDDWAPALAFSADNGALWYGRMNGELTQQAVDPAWAERPAELVKLSTVPSSSNSQADAPMEPEVAEVEPNDTVNQPQPLSLPGSVRGAFQKAGDADLYRIIAKKGDTWILETDAARSKSKADTRIDVLWSNGEPVQRAILQAVRDSWINFRPIDSSQLQVRVEFWEEMDLNQFLYMNGEIGKFFQAPRGPDSGYDFYQNDGKRRTYFDTTAAAQARDQPIYIVEAYPPGSPIVENGLPVFPLYFQNDDDGERELGSDSRLTFTAPEDGEYLVRVVDSRGFGGEDFGYLLTVRPPKPDFSVAIRTMNPKVPAGSGQRLKFKVDRIDNFDDAITLSIDNLPPGFHTANPVVVEAGHLEATSLILADADAPAPTKEQWEAVRVMATAAVNGQPVEKSVGNLGEIQRIDAPKIRVFLEPDSGTPLVDDGSFVITPGTTITANIRVERNGYDGDIRFDVDGLPHGVIVDNIGLSGVLVRKNENERQVFLTARPWVPETSVWIDAVSAQEGAQTTPPVRLTVRRPTSVAKN